MADSGGQVQGLGREAVQRILTDYHITQTLAEEGGRTSRGSIANMQNYVALLNDLHSRGLADPTTIEHWWIERIRDHFAAKPLRLRYNSSKVYKRLFKTSLNKLKNFSNKTMALFIKVSFYNI